MGADLAKVVARDKKRDKRPERELGIEDRRALQKIHIGARRAGSKLKTGGKGGLPPSLVLAVMKRDGFRCKVHGGNGVDGGCGQGIEVHHKGGIVESDWLSRKGHSNDPNNIVTLCGKAHDEIHTKAREEGVDSSQVKAEGDK